MPRIARNWSKPLSRWLSMFTNFAFLHTWFSSCFSFNTSALILHLQISRMMQGCEAISLIISAFLILLIFLGQPLEDLGFAGLQNMLFLFKQDFCFCLESPQLCHCSEKKSFVRCKTLSKILWNQCFSGQTDPLQFEIEVTWLKVCFIHVIESTQLLIPPCVAGLSWCKQRFYAVAIFYLLMLCILTLPKLNTKIYFKLLLAKTRRKDSSRRLVVKTCREDSLIRLVPKIYFKQKK